jgi:hypothetical protein
VAGRKAMKNDSTPLTLRFVAARRKEKDKTNNTRRELFKIKRVFNGNVIPQQSYGAATEAYYFPGLFCLIYEADF